MPGASSICPYCRQPLDPGARKCPHCHQWQGGSMWVPYIPSFVFLVVFVTFMSLTIHGLYQDDLDEASFEQYRDGVVLLDTKTHYRKEEGRCPLITTLGHIENRTDIPWDDLEIEVRYFDATGDLVDTGSETLYITVPADDNATFKVSSCASREEAAYATHTARIRMASDARGYL